MSPRPQVTPRWEGELTRFQQHRQDVPGLLAHLARHRTDHCALAWAPKEGPHRSWTYAELYDEVQAAAAGIERLGVRSGDRILVHSENCPEMVVTVLACATIGAVAVNTNTKSTADELAYFARRTGAIAAVTQPHFVPLLSAAAPNLSWMAVIEPPDTPLNPLPSGLLRWSSLGVPGGRAQVMDPDPQRPFCIMFTSGTTNLPKAVVHTHGNALWAARTGPRNIDLGPDDVYLIYLPLFHVNALDWSLFAVFGTGATAVLMPKWSATNFWPVALRYNATHLSFMPFVRPVLTEKNRSTSSLRVATFGRNLPGLEASTGLQFYTAFGMTETVTHAIGAKPADHCPLGSIGRVLPGYEIAVVDQVTGDLCADGEPGELWIRGTRGVQMFLEYLDDIDANEAAFEGDWFKTGDIVRVADDGVVFYQERHKDLLKVGGENVSAREVEDVIASVPGVVAAAVVGRSHQFLDQVVVAFVIAEPDADAEDLVARMNSASTQRLSSFKRPRAIHLVDAFPTGTLDKILKSQLREVAETLPVTDP